MYKVLWGVVTVLMIPAFVFAQHGQSPYVDQENPRH